MQERKIASISFIIENEAYLLVIKSCSSRSCHFHVPMKENTQQILFKFLKGAPTEINYPWDVDKCLDQ